MIHTYKAKKEDINKRLDIFVLEQLNNNTRSFIKNLVEKQKVTLNNKIVKAGALLKEDDIITVELSPPKQIDLSPENIPLDIVYQDDDLLVINKQAGIVVHPGGGSFSGTLVNALLYHVNNLSGINGEIRPGIVHRLDKDTSGLMLVAKNDISHVELSRQIATKTCVRKYMAICDGVIPYDEKIIETKIGRNLKDRKLMAVVKEGKDAITTLKVIKRYKKNTLAEFVLQTGRTHQIRVHSKHLGFPITNDKVYGALNKYVNAEGQLLHSYHIGFTHPTKKEWMQFEVDFPKHFKEFLKKVEKE